MEFEWDATKNDKNIHKHGISFETAALAFTDPHHVSIQDRVEDGEERWQTIGLINGQTLLLVAHLIWDEDENTEIIRIISARKAEPKEKKLYEQENRYC